MELSYCHVMLKVVAMAILNDSRPHAFFENGNNKSVLAKCTTKQYRGQDSGSCMA